MRLPSTLGLISAPAIHTRAHPRVVLVHPHSALPASAHSPRRDLRAVAPGMTLRVPLTASRGDRTALHVRQSRSAASVFFSPLSLRERVCSPHVLIVGALMCKALSISLTTHFSLSALPLPLPLLHRNKPLRHGFQPASLRPRRRSGTIHARNSRSKYVLFAISSALYAGIASGFFDFALQFQAFRARLESVRFDLIGDAAAPVHVLRAFGAQIPYGAICYAIMR
eukprot:2397313-Rhodomonas_salina.3